MLWVFAVVMVVAWFEWRRYQSASSATAIALHVIGHVVPLLEERGYRSYRKQVSLGRNPYIKYHMESEHGLWIDFFVDRHKAYFHIQSMEEMHGVPMDLSHRFEVSGPWDELTASELAELEDSFFKWRIDGCRHPKWQKDASDLTFFYMPMTCEYVEEGQAGFSAPTDPGYKLLHWMHQATPHQRYPLVPRLPKA